MLASAAAAGVRVVKSDLVAAIKGIPASRLPTLADEYAAAIASFQAAGIDLNDPHVWDLDHSITLEEAIDQGLL